MRGDLTRIALDLFAARGYDDVSVADIATEAGMSSRTFFRYFSSKDDLILQYERRLHERLLRALRARPQEEGPVAALRAAYAETAHLEPEDLQIVRRRAGIRDASPTLRARVAGEAAEQGQHLIEELVSRSGREEDAARLRVIAVAMSAVAADAWGQWIASGDDVDPAALIERGLATLQQEWPPDG
jgi:AcrR family transcriptional regulator